jgi:peptidoglycan/LPS O-acetylase OafA/YrhL
MMSGAASAVSILSMNLVPRSRKVVAVLGALGLAIGGLLIQFVADPAKFWPFPPGIYFILGAVLIVWLMQRWRIAPLAGILIGLWINFGGIVRGELFANLASGDVLTIVGNVVMEIGLIGAVVVGIVAIAAPDRVDSGAAA